MSAVADLDVDEMRARLVAERDEALGYADEVVFAVETGDAVGAVMIAAKYRESRKRMRLLRSLICAEEGIR